MDRQGNIINPSQDPQVQAACLVIKSGTVASTPDTLYLICWLFGVFCLCSALQRDSFELLSEDDSAEHNGPHSL